MNVSFWISYPTSTLLPSTARNDILQGHLFWLLLTGLCVVLSLVTGYFVGSLKGRTIPGVVEPMQHSTATLQERDVPICVCENSCLDSGPLQCVRKDNEDNKTNNTDISESESPPKLLKMEVLPRRKVKSKEAKAMNEIEPKLVFPTPKNNEENKALPVLLTTTNKTSKGDSNLMKFLLRQKKEHQGVKDCDTLKCAGKSNITLTLEKRNKSVLKSEDDIEFKSAVGSDFLSFRSAKESQLDIHVVSSSGIDAFKTARETNIEIAKK